MVCDMSERAGGRNFKIMRIGNKDNDCFPCSSVQNNQKTF